MKRLFIIRGLPGSGKTTFATQIAGRVYEADLYFTTIEGEYEFKKERISDAHKWCQAGVEIAMKCGTLIIAVSNTFVRRWEMDAYYDLARVFHYEVTEITMSGKLHKNVHGVPDEVIERMRNSWER